VRLVRRAIPKKAVKALIEHCNRFGEKTGRSGAGVFSDYLKWMKKHADYFFSSPWPQKYVPKKGGWLTELECVFIDGSGGYDEEIERFTIVLLKRNLSLEGFNAEYFESEFDFYGRMACRDCGVPEAVRLREYTKKLEETMLEMNEKVSSGLMDDFWARVYEYRKSPECTRSDRMAYVKLEFLEADGGAEGKTCSIRNKYLCPYGAKALELIDLGGVVGFLWRLVEFYDAHWNVSHTRTPPSSEDKWFHWGEAGILDVTRREDILLALEDGRMNKISLEYAGYTKEKNKG
jgi:hypothetical protein